MFFLIEKVEFSGDKNHRTIESKLKIFLLYRKTRLLPHNVGKFHRTCATFHKLQLTLYINTFHPIRISVIFAQTMCILLDNMI